MEFSAFFIGPTAGQGSEREVQQAILREARLADELGFDAVWLAEHHFDATFSTIPSPNLLLAALAMRTERVKLGCAINVLPFHHPLRIAEEGAMLDQLSNGRFQWGIGRGITGHEFHSFRIAPAESRTLFNEIHDAVIDAWRTGRMAFEGELVKVPPTDIAPGVVQRPHPPVWVTAQSPDSVAWAARHPDIRGARGIGAGHRRLSRHRDRGHPASDRRARMYPPDVRLLAAERHGHPRALHAPVRSRSHARVPRHLEQRIRHLFCSSDRQIAIRFHDKRSNVLIRNGALIQGLQTPQSPPP
jgi:hypothetical protein